MANILLFCSLTRHGGVSSHVTALSRLLRQHGANVTIASLCEEMDNAQMAELRDAGIRILSTGLPHSAPQPLKWAAALSWARHLRPNSFDVVCGFGASGAFRLLKPLKRSGGWFVYNECSCGLRDRPPKSMFQQTLRSVDGVLTLSLFARNAMKACVPKSTPVKALAHFSCVGIDIPPAAERLRQNGVPQLAYLGRLDRNKNIRILLELASCERLRPFSMRIYGDGPERTSLAHELATRGLLDRVQLMGAYDNRRDLGAIFQSVDVVLLPSKDEGLGLVLLEALAHGVPFVATSVGGPQDIARFSRDLIVALPQSNEFTEAVILAVNRIRSGAGDPRALQEIYKRNFAYDVLAPRWIEAFLKPDLFWATAE